MSNFDENKVSRLGVGTPQGGQFSHKDCPPNDLVGLPPVADGACINCGESASTIYGGEEFCSSCLNGFLGEDRRGSSVCVSCGQPPTMTIDHESYCDACLDQWGTDTVDQGLLRATA